MKLHPYHNPENVDESRVDPPEFLFEAMHATKIACGNHEVSANPIRVLLEAPKKKTPVPRRDQTDDELKAVKCLKEQVTYPLASWDKRFARDLLTTTITEKEAAQVWRLFHKYRRQIHHAEKSRLLEVADERQRIAATKSAPHAAA